MEEIAEQQTLFMQQDVKYMVTFILATLERNWEKDLAKAGTMPKIDQITMNSQYTHKYQHEFWQGYLSFDIKRESISKAWKRIMGR